MKYALLVLSIWITPYSFAATSLLAPKTVKGFADLHNHLFAELAHGGAWLHGTVEGDLAHALASCETLDDPLSMLGNHARVKFPVISHFIGKTIGSAGDTGSHADKYAGYPSFSGWPRWDTIAHQQVWEGYLKEAHERGLSLLVASAVNFEPFCKMMPEENMKFKDCSDMVAVDRQIEAIDHFEKTHDWFQVVHSAAEARNAIESGKLAVIISIEVSNLFGKEELKAALERYYQKGVRTLQIAHQLNNRFAGAAIHNPIFRAIQWFTDFDARGTWYEIFTPMKFGFDLDAEKHNKMGLTEEGRQLITEMMNRKMPIDLAHLSEHTVHDVQALTLARKNYPVYVSHGHFRDAMDDGKFSVWEKSSSAWVLDYIRDSGGIFGLRTGPEKTKAFADLGAPLKTEVDNDCQGSSKSFAQTYQYGTKTRGLSVAFGSDLNGFIQQTRPRFGGEQETCGAEQDEQKRHAQQQAQRDPLGKTFDHSGLGQMAQLPDLLQDLKNEHVDTSSLESSAEKFIEMWEKAESL